jgi:hypothetical protein
MWKHEQRCSEILSITNGVHRRTWVAESLLSEPSDPEKVWAAHDCGKALNPTIVEGQIEGCVYMGVGEALSE